MSVWDGHSCPSLLTVDVDLRAPPTQAGLTPAAERRKNLAQRFSAGSVREVVNESRRDGTTTTRHRALASSAQRRLGKGTSSLVLQQSMKDSGFNR